MSADIYAVPDLTKKVRQKDGEGGQRGDTEDSGRLEVTQRDGDIGQNGDSGQVVATQRDGDRGQTGDSGQVEETAEMVHIYENVDDFRSYDMVLAPWMVKKENTAGRRTRGRGELSLSRDFSDSKWE